MLIKNIDILRFPKNLNCINSSKLMKSKKKIAICGTRGVPANYGGFETFAEELGARLVERGYDVTVYGRVYGKDNLEQGPSKYRGMNCVSIRAYKHKYFETPLHTLF